MREEKYIINYKDKKEEAYDMKKIIQKQTGSKESRNYYDESINALIQYMKNNEKNPSEKIWDKMAIKEPYLSSKTIGYISGIGFNKLCRNLRKQINKSKRQQKF